MNSKAIFSAIAGLVGLPYLGQAQSVASPESNKSVAAELASFKVADGYRVELFASEELGIANPVTMRWDERGRLWVLCIPFYPQPKPGEQPNDKLIILEDHNGDRKADQSTVFADSLHIPLGFELGHGGVYVGEQTELLHLKDTNNDGKADTRKVLLSGFGTGDLHQTINSFTWSPGGELYFSQGLSIYSRVETPEGVKKADRAAIWRYRPLRFQLDSFLDGSTASDNPWGMNFGEWGEMFVKGNSEALFYTVPGLVKGPHRAPIPPIGHLEIKGSIVEIPRTRHLPDELWNTFLLAGYYNNQVERMRVREEGSGYVAQLIQPLLTSSSRSFRPVDVKVGPDGAIYVLDWYNPIIGHYQASMRHPDRDRNHGRVWRITANNRPLVQPPRLAEQPIPILLDQLKSEEHWVRYQVKRLLAASPLEDIKPALTAWVANLDPQATGYEHHLMEAIGVCESHEWVNSALLDRLLKGKEFGARAYAARVVGRWHHQLPVPLSLLEPLVNDPHPRVRLEALVATSAIHQQAAMVLAAQVLDHPTDKFIHHALNKTIYALQSAWEPALRTGTLTFKKPAHLAQVIATLPPSWYSAEQFRQLIQAGELLPEATQSLLVELVKVGQKADLAFVLSHPAARTDAGLLDRLSKLAARPLPEESVASLRSSLVSAKSSDVRLAAIRLTRSWQIAALVPTISSLTKNMRVPTSIRAESVAALVQLKGREALPLLRELVNSANNPRIIRLAAVKAMSECDLALAATATVQEMRRSGTSIQVMLDALSPIIDRRGGISALTRELAKVSFPKKLARLALEALAAKGQNAPELRSRLNQLAEAGSVVQRVYEPAYVEELAQAVKEKGDPLKGAVLYQSMPSCAACHTVQGKGGNIGPNLSAIGRGLSPREIITEVLWPNQNVKEGYEMVTVETRKGEVIQGNKVFETADVLYVKTTTAKDAIKIAKADVAKQTSQGSLMPSGLLNALSEEEVRDLIRYLSELGSEKETKK